ncbi:MAG: hypothetical protein BAJALOKI1v1_290001 [Promethearchaeota archaeon]|nr:MAG: hypothetical protein BAJALOKI1v1_290001 [Candidatus Lokiarchaeota archaeon]
MNHDELLGVYGNLKPIYASCLEEHKIFIENQKFYLIKTFYGTNTKEDFLKTYQNSLDQDLMEKIAIIPDIKAYNEYGIVYNLSLEVVAVFNMKFADYNRNLQKIVFRTPEEVLISFHKGDFSTIKSLDQQLKNKFELCREKVNTMLKKRIDLHKLHPPPPSVYTDKNLRPSLPPPPGPLYKNDKKKKDKNKRDWMNHAIMYASIIPIDSIAEKE